MEFIIGSFSKLKVGDIAIGTYFYKKGEIYPNTRFRIVALVTYEDWVKFRKDNNLGDDNCSEADRNANFYRAITD
jgi:hypothetical protein